MTSSFRRRSSDGVFSSYLLLVHLSIPDTRCQNAVSSSPGRAKLRGRNRPVMIGFRGLRRKSFVPGHGLRNSTDVLRPRFGRSPRYGNQPGPLQGLWSRKRIPVGSGKNIQLPSCSPLRRDRTARIRSISRGKVDMSGLRRAADRPQRWGRGMGFVAFSRCSRSWDRRLPFLSLH